MTEDGGGGNLTGVPVSFKYLVDSLQHVARLAHDRPDILEGVANCLQHVREAGQEFLQLQKQAFGDWITTAEAAQELQLSVVLLARKARAGDLPAVWKGSGWLFPKWAIREYKLSVAGKSLNDPTRGEELK
jgi:hypothetical protein